MGLFKSKDELRKANIYGTIIGENLSLVTINHTVTMYNIEGYSSLRELVETYIVLPPFKK